MKRQLLVAIALLLFSSSLSAQTFTITRDDFTPYLNAQAVTTYTNDSLAGMPLTIGSAGSNFNVSLTGISFIASTVGQEYVDPSITPYANEFPTATHAMITGDAANQAFMYLRVASDGVYQLGIAMDYSGTPVLLKFTPEEPMMKFPMTVGTKWTYTGNEMEPLPGMGLFMQRSASVEADAAGTLVLPSGSYPCLRMKVIEWNTQKLSIGGTVLQEDRYQTATYRYLTKAGIEASLDVDTNTVGSASVNLNSAMYSVFLGTTPVNTAAPAPSDLAITKMYPNPVAAGTTMTWTSSTQAQVTVGVYDITGRLVADVFQGSITPGTHQTRIDASQLKSGVYVVRATDGARTARTLMTVVR